MNQPELRFDGCVERCDTRRLTRQQEIIASVMMQGQWRTLGEIAALTQQPEASISAQLRNMRKPRFGGYTVEKRRRGEASRGLWEYHVAVPLARAA